MASSCRSFYSHRNPDVLLKEHLEHVGNLCAFYFKTSMDEEKVLKTAELIGRCHDLGKYTSFFQDHLAGKSVKSSLSPHSPLSALLASWIINRRLHDPFLMSAAFLTVLCHHGSLKSLDNIPDEIGRLKVDAALRLQIRSIKENLTIIRRELDELGLTEAHEFISAPYESIAELKEVAEHLDPFSWKKETRWKNYFTIMLLYSSLIDADRKDAGMVQKLIDREYKPIEISPNIVISYKKSKFKTPIKPIDELRDKLFDSAKESLDTILKGNPTNVVTITAPTGTGKTLLGFYVALRLRKACSKDKYEPKIIYSLPFINIIEQTHSVLNDILSNSFGKVPLQLLLKYHHLHFPDAVSEKEIPLDKLLLLMDAWDSEIIVTTFEQLIYSLIGNKASLIKKFHNIANSILILDEVQAIPLEYWKVVNEALTNLARNFNVKIILMTATRPTIFQGDVEVVPDHKLFFRKLNRITIVPCLDRTLRPEEVVSFFLSKWDYKSSALIVLNTIRSSKAVYQNLSERLKRISVGLGSGEWEKEAEDESKVVLTYLSTNVIPNERRRRVEILKDLLKRKRKVILVSTQVVEAGVDLDFDMALRDLGPLDSIVQVAGRCNRGGGHIDKSNVYIVRVVDERGRGDSEKIYGNILPSVTINLLKGRNIIEECELLDIMNDYYNDISYRCNVEFKEEYLKAMENLDYDKLSNFTIIKDVPKTSVFIELDDTATNVLERFKDTLKSLDTQNLREFFELKAALRKIKAQLEGYIVDAWPNDRINNLEEIAGIKHVPKRVVDAYYDKETGLISDGEENTLVW